MSPAQTSVAATERALACIAAREDGVRAWVHIGEDQAREAAAIVDRNPVPAPLGGLVLGVKDVFDTAVHPTEYGCRAYVGHRPRADAAAVSMLRVAGAVCLGKTVTAELAMFHPGPTRNPWRLTHTPGGSSSGSAAAVAAGMADIALGTQTGGSIIRPASFCGVWGFKPTFGTVSVAGLKLVAPSLDTVGWFARSVKDLDSVREVLTGHGPRPAPTSPRIGLVRTAAWELADPDCREVVEEATARARSAGASVVDVPLPAEYEYLSEAQQIVQSYESARSLTWERTQRAAELSESLRGILEWGAAIPAEEFDAVRHRAAVGRASFGLLFSDVDVLLTPAVLGEAPAGLDSTGDPRFARLWTLLGVPALNVPGLHGATGLPIGVQLIARSGMDGELLTWGEWLGQLLID